ncbi:MAG TPA: hypothetical protein PK831_00910 [Candidatus Magasanikbacteria bacterium]|jgi:hypothetical protein|nr:hypothetical protein [Candidatus Magasanikbacteria bacterium]HQF57049.1 hypothetical protein [Candidatus Magasanikbacteria bacterium]HQL52827.1 hypothetical protein [Candidatus Magasanikbacteria bacterium]
MWKTNKKNTYQSKEYEQFLSLRIVSIIIIILIISIVFCGFYFVKKNIFGTITQAEEVIIFKNNLINEVIDFKKYEAVSENWNKKNNPLITDINNLRDPFNLTATTSKIEE